MQGWVKVTLAVLAALVVCSTAFVLGYVVGNRDDTSFSLIGGGSSGGDGLGLVEDAYAEIRSSAVEAPSDEALARGAIKGMLEVVKKDDPYALFYSPTAYRSFQELTTGKFSGIGVWLKQKEEGLTIVSVLPATPAVESGLREGDVIRTIDGEPVSSLSSDEAVAHVKGPEGTEVALGIERAGETLDFTITRESIELPNLQANLRADGLGYIRLFGFARGAAGEVREEVDEMLDEGAEGIVLDLRDNGGGLFSEAVDVASVFIEDGEVVIYRERASGDTTYEAEGDAFEDVPLVVLVNEGTASASEIVAGALQDQERATLIGTTTYGKGSVQEVVRLRDSSALKLTTAAYLTPEGRNINGFGIAPDVEVAETPDQKDRAVEILKGIIISTSGAQG
ncbi:MAG: S41 family peptidase [Actinomycetota bacterium]|nr:S41 family peptidase [Actinomycetota bacterium]